MWNFESSKADELSNLMFENSCHEFKELMVAGNKLIFLRSNDPLTGATWKAVLCLNCSAEKESTLLKVTNIKNGSTDWHFKNDNFQELSEVISSEDDVSKEALGMHSILTLVRRKCRSYLDPVNEGSHLQLTGNESCVRHEYLRLYLKRKFNLNENKYTEIESKKDLLPEEFLLSCHQIMKQSVEENSVIKVLTIAYIKIRVFFGIGLGEYDPVVSKDSKTSHRDIATEETKQKLK